MFSSRGTQFPRFLHLTLSTKASNWYRYVSQYDSLQSFHYILNKKIPYFLGHPGEAYIRFVALGKIGGIGARGNATGTNSISFPAFDLRCPLHWQPQS